MVMYVYGCWCDYVSCDYFHVLSQLVSSALLIVVSHNIKLLSRMAPETRGHAGNNPPPPPKPDMTQVLRLMLEDREAARAERQANLATLQHLAQIATHHNNNGGNDEPQNKLRDFQNSNPPVFSKSTEPLDADDWLRTIENKLEYARVGANDKVLYATHFLAGAAGAWWENVRAMQPEGLQDQVSQGPYPFWTHQDYEGQVPQSEARRYERS
jgi:hypothetical protein